ncbi:hypothetical protein [Sutcliffiella halmapala]|uniref:hypothetical protein n=1 Tax=Sutcliffiella halmapala TaxID=79882 RepID=UPI000994A8E2|nr:hypothetical protein [Sutcliffiella halmapala]
MVNEVRKAKLKLDFEHGFILAPELNAEDALKAVLKALKDGGVSEVKIAVEYNEGIEAEEVEKVEVVEEGANEDDYEDDDDEE